MLDPRSSGQLVRPCSQPYRSGEIWITIGRRGIEGYLYRPIVAGWGLGWLQVVGLGCTQKGGSILSAEE
jgi:hypothetical protein